MSQKKVLITGGSGFIGKNLKEYLTDKFIVTAPTRGQLDLLNAEAVSAFLSGGSFDCVVHAAGTGVTRVGNSSQIFETNVKMFNNLVENSEKFGRMIFLGSGAEYGKQQPIIKVLEKDFGKILPEDEYGKAKYFASEYILKHPNIVNLRCFGVFGKYEDYTTRFISNAIVRAICGLPITLRQNAKFDYIYINDLVKIIEHFIIYELKEKFYNIGSGQSMDLLSLAEMVKIATGGQAEIKVLNLGQNKEYTANNSLLKGELSGFQFTPFPVAISEMTQWYREHQNLIDQKKLNFDA